MKRLFACVLLALLLLQTCAVSAETTMRIEDKAYDLEVSTVYMRTFANGTKRILKTEMTTGVMRDVNSIALEYDYEAQSPECVGRYAEDAPVALVTVHGFDKELAVLPEDEVVLTVNGLPIDAEEAADVYGHVGWKDVYRTGEMSVVFPIELTAQGGISTYTVRVQGLCDGVRITETAQVEVELINTHEYKAEKEAQIVHITSEDAEVYIVGETIYVDHPVGSDQADIEIALRFKDENGAPFAGITWAENTLCKAENAQAALYLQKEVRLDEDSEAVYRLESGCAQERREKVRFVLDTKDALYKTKEYRVIERFDVRKEDPKGVYFAQTEVRMQVGEYFAPTVLSVKTDEILRSGVFGKLTIAAGENTDAQVIDVSDGKGVIAVKPGKAYITARYETDGAVYEAASMKIVVTEKTVREGIVLCRNLNVRAGAGMEAQIVGMLHRGDSVQVVRVENGWAQLADGRYVSEKYIG